MHYAGIDISKSRLDLYGIDEMGDMSMKTSSPTTNAGTSG